MAEMEDIGTISGIGNYSPSGGELSANDSPYLKVISGSPEYRFFTAPLSNKGNPTGYYGSNSIAVGPDTPIRLIDTANGKLIMQGSGYSGAEEAIKQATQLTAASGKDAGWEIQIVPPGSQSFASVAREKVNPGFADIALQVLSVAAQIGVAVATSGASLPAQMAAQAGTAAAFTIAQGGSLGDAIKAGVMAAAPVLGARELGPLINSGLNAASPIVGKAIGAGISSAAAGALTGQNLEQMATSGVISGITTALMPDISKTVKGLVGASATSGGSSGGSAGGDGGIVVTGNIAPGATVVTGGGGKSTDAVKQTKAGETPENVLVEGTTTSGATPVTGVVGASDAVKQTIEGSTPENVLVEGEKTPGATATTTTNADAGSGLEKDIIVNAQKSAGVGPTVNLSPNMSDIGDLINSDEFQKFVDEEIAKDPEKKGLTTGDWIRLALLVPQLIPLLKGDGNDAGVTIGQGGRVEYTPLRRAQNVGTPDTVQSGLGSYGYNPFTYGQAGLGQPEEYLFFGKPITPSVTPGAAPTTQVAGISAPAATTTTAGASANGNPPPGSPPPGDTTGGTTGGSARLTLPPGTNVGGGAPIVLEGGNKGPATPANTGYTPAQLTGRQTYFDLMRDPNVANLTSNINKTIASQLSANKISLEQARGINNQLQALYQTPGTTSEAIRGLATTALRDATTAYKAGSPVPTLLAEQNPDSATYQAGVGPADVYAAEGGYIGYADGGEVGDDMVSHLIAYRKGGGHDGPGHVKGIGSGQEDKIPAWLSDGEYVWSAQDVADLGDGSTDEGVRRLDKMRQMVRKRAGRKDVKKIAKPQKGIDEMLMAVGGRV